MTRRDYARSCSSPDTSTSDSSEDGDFAILDIIAIDEMTATRHRHFVQATHEHTLLAQLRAMLAQGDLAVRLQRSDS